MADPQGFWALECRRVQWFPRSAVCRWVRRQSAADRKEHRQLDRGEIASGMPEPVSVDDAIPVSLVMSGDGAEGAGSIVKVGPEGSGSFDTMGGDASAVTTIGPSPTTVSPAPPTKAAAASNCLVLMARPLSRDRRGRRSILVILLVRLDELRRLDGCHRNSSDLSDRRPAPGVLADADMGEVAADGQHRDSV